MTAKDAKEFRTKLKEFQELLFEAQGKDTTQTASKVELYAYNDLHTAVHSAMSYLHRIWEERKGVDND